MPVRAAALATVFADWFAKDSDTWNAWRSFLRVLFDLPMSAADIDCYFAHTGRDTLPNRPFKEAWVVAGRRAGKSLIASLVAVFVLRFPSWADPTIA
jgi:hypothetical protein